MKANYFKFISSSKLNSMKIKKDFNRACLIKYTVIDNFLKKEYANDIAQEHKSIKKESWLKYNHFNQKKMGISDLRLMGKQTKKLIKELSSTKFTNWLSYVSGINNLISDPMLDGGGLHKISNGGYLNIHTDFQSHTKKKNWKRRINLLLYISPDYHKSWNGELELRSYKDGSIINSISPIFNRCVIFVTDNKSFHGHPKPLKSPAGSARRSLALYYFQILEENLPLKPTNYIPIASDNKIKKLLIRLDVFAVYIFSFLKRHTVVKNDSFHKIKKFFKK